MTRTRRLAALTLSLAALTLPLTVSSSSAAVQAKHYSSCSALQKVYPHGVGKQGARDKSSSTPVRNFTVSTKVYGMNDGPRNQATGEYDLDRDNDGVACEKR